MINENQQYTTQLIPGETIKYIEGEIQTFFVYEWGIEGYLINNSRKYKFRIKKNIHIRDHLCSGLNIIFINGFCIKNKRGEIIITDGKFGRVEVYLRFSNYFYRKEGGTETLTGRIKQIIKGKELDIIRINTVINARDEIEIIVERKQNKIFNEQTIFYKDKIVRAMIQNKEKTRILRDIEILLLENFWYKMLAIETGKTTELGLLIPMMNKQRIVIMEQFDRIKQELMMIKGNISRINIEKLKEVLYAKITNGNWKNPYCLLIPDKKIEQYCNGIIKFLKEIRKIHIEFETVEEIIILIENYYPPIQMQKEDVYKISQEE
ncbi:MAG: hypothetical protein ACTSQE_10450 [Candidatus Heimdallarchaeaceae archaeon]